MKKIMLVFGTRPEAIKMCPLAIELKRRESIATEIVVTGQHREMLESVLNLFDVRADRNLCLMREGQTLFELTEQIIIGIKQILIKSDPSVVVVHGDTTTAFATALSAFYLNIPVAHVEAGLRSGNIKKPFPEEFNRKAISLISEYNFAPTENAMRNLIFEGVNKSTIFVTGNTIVDALLYTKRTDFHHPILEWVGDNKFILMTVHRRESIGEPMRDIFRGVKRAVLADPRLRVIYPMHMNPTVKKIAMEELYGIDQIMLTDPMDTVTFHNIMRKSYIVLTDSGGIQEEATSIGKPTLVVRNETERIEGVESGTLKLIGTDQDTVCSAIINLCRPDAGYMKMSKSSEVYGNGHASAQIADILCKNL